MRKGHFPSVGNPLGGGNLGASDSDTVLIAPGLNVTANGPTVAGTKNVQVNDGVEGGVAKLSPFSTYTGWTRLSGGTLWADNLTDSGVGSLGASDSLVLGPGTFRYDGPENGLWSGTVTNTTKSTEATVIDVENSLTMQGKWGWKEGGFVKTGAGALTLKNTAGGNGELGRTGITQLARIYHLPLDLKENGDSPSQGFTKLTVAEGKLVFGGGN